MPELMRSLVSDDAGATAIEYALMAAMIAGFIAATVFVVGQQVSIWLGSVIDWGG